MQLGADAGSAGPEISERDVRQQPPRRFDERLERLAVVLVIPFGFLVADGGAQQDVPSVVLVRWTPRPWPDGCGTG